MKCPTCGYIGFETSDRCRNCGYDFSHAAAPAEAPELALKTDQPEGALREIDLRVAAAATAATAGGRVTADRRPDIDKVLQNLDRVIGETPAVDLPLFDDPDGEVDLAPLVDPNAAPRRPLSVRRTTPDPAKLRQRTTRHEPAPPRALELPLPSVEEPAPPPRGPRPAPVATREETLDSPAALPLQRLAAAAIDVAILGGISLAVVYFTVRLCGLTMGEALTLPLVPLVGFLVILSGGYLAAFTAAGGQTIGKMALGLKVVSRDDLPVSGGLAIVRAVGCLGSVASLGIGFLPALVGGDGRALEDRVADTRVVRVAA